MAEILLNKRYWAFRDDAHYSVERIEAEFKTQGLIIKDTGKSSITINRKGQKILYEELKRRFGK